MRRTVLNSLLLVIAAGLLSLNWLLRIDPGQRNLEVMPDMARSAAYHSFAPNPNFRDGMTLRPLPPGVVVRDVVSPFARKGLPRGATVFGTYCEICHGAGGKGDGTVAQRGFPAPPSLLAPKALALTDAQIFTIMSNGQKNMPSYASQIDRDDRWNAVLYVRSLQRSAALTGGAR